MNFDVVIIGGGIAGLICGIELQQQGKRCAIINNGQAAVDFSSGSFDLLGSGASGENIRYFDQNALDALPSNHPYRLWGAESIRRYAKCFEQLAENLSLGLNGECQENHLRVTPLGGLRPSWLSPSSVPTVKFGERFPFEAVTVLGIQGYHDFQPELLAENLKRQSAFAHCAFHTDYLSIPELDQLRQQGREFRSVNISQLLEHRLAFAELVNELKQSAREGSAVFLPACFGLEDQQFFQQLRQASGLALFELPTLPPSLIGIRHRKRLHQHFEQLGGLMLNGDRALRAEFDGARVHKIYTQLHPNNGLKANEFVLASGSFFSNGLIAEFERIVEPVFDLDIQGCENFDPNDRLSWTNSRFAGVQPYHSAGVVINAECRVRKAGKFAENLYAVGSVIGGYQGIAQACGSGVALVSALIVAEQILKGGKDE